MVYKIEVSRQYLKDLKLARKRQLDEKLLNDIIAMLAAGEPLPAKNCDHALSGNYKGYRECHVTPDWLLIYSRNETLKVVSISTYRHAFGFILNLPAVHDVDPSVHDGILTTGRKTNVPSFPLCAERDGTSNFFAGKMIMTAASNLLLNRFYSNGRR